MANLILPSLEIQNFRAFEHLRIERLGRVNLITGKNNVGKTCLLEALHLYANNGAFLLVRDLLDTRDELRTSTSGTKILARPEKGDIDFTNIRHLFYGRPSIQDRDHGPFFNVGPLEDKHQTLTMFIEWRQLVESQNPDGFLVQKWEQVTLKNAEVGAIKRPYLVSQFGTQFRIQKGLDTILLSSGRVTIEKQYIHDEYIKSHGLDNRRLAQLWDSITLSPLEADVLEGIQIIAPNVSRVGIISQSDEERELVPIILTSPSGERLPLHSLGDGTSRLFGIVLALVNVQNGMLLLDEVDTGLHYSVLLQVWKLIFKLAQRLNVQVFATTHSWDCIEAFERAAREDENAQAELIHLMRQDEGVLAVLYDKEELGIVTEEMIEVR